MSIPATAWHMTDEYSQLIFTFDQAFGKEDVELINVELAKRKFVELSIGDSKTYFQTVKKTDPNHQQTSIDYYYGYRRLVLKYKTIGPDQPHTYQLNTYGFPAGNHIDMEAFTSSWRKAHPDRIIRVTVEQNFGKDKDAQTGIAVLHHEKDSVKTPVLNSTQPKPTQPSPAEPKNESVSFFSSLKQKLAGLFKKDQPDIPKGQDPTISVKAPEVQRTATSEINLQPTQPKNNVSFSEGRDLFTGLNITAVPDSNAGSAEKYYFQNMQEFLLYSSLTNKNISWAEGSSYSDEFMKGYQLYEEGKYADAIKAYQHCLALNPVGIHARFEMCETYIKMKQPQEALKFLLESKKYFIENTHIARFYRRLAYIEVDLGNGQLAAACNQYSLKYEQNNMAESELRYLSSKGIARVPDNQLDTVLTEGGIPLSK